MKKHTILLSDYLKVNRSQLENYGVFDVLLGIDTKLFIDPKLLEQTTIPEFKEARADILNYLEALIKIISQSKVSEQMKDIALSKIAVKEPVGLSIGYGNKTDDGTSIPKNVAYTIIDNLVQIINIGIESPELVELMAIFVKGFGPDSLSDLTTKIIYERFCEYTQRISLELKLEVKDYVINNKSFKLPEHPFKKTQIIFLPSQLTGELPIANDWDEVCKIAEHNEELREQANKIFITSISEILSKSIKNSDEEKSLKENMINLVDLYKNIKVESYSIVEDKLGFYNLGNISKSISEKIELPEKPKNIAELIFCVRKLIEQFQKQIEHNGLNKFLHRKDSKGNFLPDKHHNEEYTQLLFYSVADTYCSLLDISLNRETNAGRGPVDFSLSTGYSKKILVEIKKSTNSSLLDGYSKQLIEYSKGESSAYNFYLVVNLNKRSKKKTNLDILIERNNKSIENKEKVPELIVIDGSLKPSPSNLH